MRAALWRHLSSYYPAEHGIVRPCVPECYSRALPVVAVAEGAPDAPDAPSLRLVDTVSATLAAQA